MRESILELLERAMTGTEKLAPKVRADLYDAAAQLLSSAPEELMLSAASAAAAKAATALREAETHQLTFASLLRQP